LIGHAESGKWRVIKLSRSDSRKSGVFGADMCAGGAGSFLRAKNIYIKTTEVLFAIPDFSNLESKIFLTAIEPRKIFFKSRKNLLTHYYV
jgi:hypothetical protein